MALVFLPGMDGTGQLQRWVAPAMPVTLEELRVLAYPRDRLLDYEGLVDFVFRQTRDLDGPFTLVGESFSAAVAARFAAHHPGRVSSLVMIAGFIDPPAPRFLSRVVRDWMFRIPFPSLAVRLMETGVDASPELVRAAKRAIKSTPPEVLSHRLRTVLTTDSADALRQVTCPILVLWGTADRLVTRSRTDRILELAPHAISVPIRDGPHLLAQAKPDAVRHAIATFLAQVASGSSPSGGG
jgi:pimeloyl-ACP methyl ester carboxylesterase